MVGILPQHCSANANTQQKCSNKHKQRFIRHGATPIFSLFSADFLMSNVAAGRIIKSYYYAHV
jgi:hypothetical protein